MVSSVFGVVLGSFIWSVILQLAVRWIQKLKVKYWDAYMTVLLPAILNYVLSFIIFGTIVAGARSVVVTIIVAILMLLGFFFIQVGFVSYRIKIPFGRACLVTLAYVIGIILFAVAISLISWLLSILYINFVR